MALISALAVHDTEEWVRDLPAWSAARTFASGLMPADVHRGFGVALLLVSLLPVVGATAIRWLAPRTEPAWLALFAWVLIANALWHAVLSLATWTAMPGILTATTLLLPASGYALAGLPLHRASARIIILAVLAMVAVTAATLAFAALIVRLSPGATS